MRRAVAALVAAGALAAPAGSAQAAEVIGQTAPGLNCMPGTALQEAVAGPPSYTVPEGGGVITAWSHFESADSGNQMRLKVFRRTAVTTGFVVVGQSALETLTPDVVNNFATRISVQGGDVLGISWPSLGADCDVSAPPGNSERLSGGDPAPGSTVSFGPPFNGVRVNVSAIVEPDCDGDGFGDETQDDNLNSCPPGPSAAITSVPADKVKTKKKRVNVTFAFDANEAGAAFNCVLDGQQEFKACASPLTVSVKKGEHTFSVTATDVGGNAGAAATDTFKVKRKKKKK